MLTTQVVPSKASFEEIGVCIVKHTLSHPLSQVELAPVYHKPTHTHTHTLSLSIKHTHHTRAGGAVKGLIRGDRRVHRHTLSLTDTLFPSNTHTHTHTHTHIHTHTHTPHTRSGGAVQGLVRGDRSVHRRQDHHPGGPRDPLLLRRQGLAGKNFPRENMGKQRPEKNGRILGRRRGLFINEVTCYFFFFVITLEPKVE